MVAFKKEKVIKSLFLFFALLSDVAFQNHSRLRTPPLPLSHSHSPNHHHAASINSLNRANYTPRSNPSPAPTDSSAPPEGTASGQDSGSAQDNWLLNSNIPLETRYRLSPASLSVPASLRLECELLSSNPAFHPVCYIWDGQRGQSNEMARVKVFGKNTSLWWNKRKALVLTALLTLAVP